MRKDRWLIVGYGSSLHSDDGVGPLVVEKLRSRVCASEIECLTGLQLTPEWAEPLSRASGAIFVDATESLPPGEIRCVPMTPMNLAAKQPDGLSSGSPTSSTDSPPESRASTHPPSFFTHSLTPESLLLLSLTVYGKAPPAWLFLIGAADLALGESLSAPVRTMVPRMLELIEAKIETNFRE